MNISQYLASPYFQAGLFELDLCGTIICSRFRKSNVFIDMTSELSGKNLFDENNEFLNIKDFQRKFKNFVNGNQFGDNFIFNCKFAEEIIPVKVMMIRAYERNCLESANLIILDIRKSTNTFTFSE